MDIEIDEPITIELRQSYVDAEQGMQKDYLKLLEDNILMRTMRESQ